jgi:hypothetical protein
MPKGIVGLFDQVRGLIAKRKTEPDGAQPPPEPLPPVSKTTVLPPQ